MAKKCGSSSSAASLHSARARVVRRAALPPRRRFLPSFFAFLIILFVCNPLFNHGDFVRIHEEQRLLPQLRGPFLPVDDSALLKLPID